MPSPSPSPTGGGSPAAGRTLTVTYNVPVSDGSLTSTKPVTITGAVTKIEWTNPHIYLYVDAKDTAGALANWAVEMGNPLQLIRLGWTRNDMKIGDSVTIDGWLARDGSKLLNAKSVVVAGKKMFAGSTQGITP